MNALTPTQIEMEVLVASPGRPAESFVKPERDLSTPRGRLLFIRDAVERTPGAKIKMLYFGPFDNSDSCGCAMHMAVIAGLPMDRHMDSTEWAEWLSITEDQAESLFAVHMRDNCYPIPNGEPAKAEFLRRLDAILAKQTS